MHNFHLYEFEAIIKIVLSAILAGFIGMERESSHRAAGLRTYILVAIGSTLFTIIGFYGFKTDFTSVDPTRIAAKIVTGIGFLGAGTIIKQGLNIKGLTTAAGLWSVAAIGMACGAGLFIISIITTLLVVVVLFVLKNIEQSKFSKHPIFLSFNVNKDEKKIDMVKDWLSRYNVTPIEIDIEECEKTLQYNFALEIPKHVNRDLLLVDLKNLGADAIKFKCTTL